MMDLEKLTIKQAHKLLREREISSEELTNFYLKRIKINDKKINSFITVVEREAIKAAQQTDKRIKEGKFLSILDGLPIAIKDNILTKDIRTTAGSKILENFIPPFDATVIKRLKKAGAVILGKTNLDEFAMGSSTENSYFGPTKNPFDLKRVPGGSSGGSAAAVAADFCIFALGSDTGGSIRQPASFCSVVGFKPSYGAVSRYGLIAMASSLDQIGPITKTVEDVEIVFEFIKGKDRFDSTSVDLFKKGLRNKEIKIGIPKEYFGKGLDKRIKRIIEELARKLEKNGIKFEEISLPSTEFALATYYIIMPAEASSNLARYDGIKYGYSEGDPKLKNLIEFYRITRAKGFGKEVKRRIMLGTFVLSAGYWEAYYLKAQKARALIKKDFEKAFERVDFLLTPTSPTPPFKLKEKIKDPLAMYLSDIYTVSPNLAGLPVISIPCGWIDNLPVGVQLIGAQFKDYELLEFAKKVEEVVKNDI